MRMGLHSNAVRSADKVVDYYRRTQAPVWKVLELRPDIFERVKAVSPGTKIIYRKYEKRQLYGSEGSAWIDRLVREVQHQSLVDYVEGYNECDPFGQDDMRQYVQFETRRVQRLADVGKRSVVANYSTGTIGRDHQGNIMRWQFDALAPLLELSARLQALWGIHEYSAPFMQWLNGGNQWDHARHTPIRVDDPCGRRDLTVTFPNGNRVPGGFLMFRYEMMHHDLSRLGYPTLPFVITEGGIDGGVNPRPGPQGGGWKSFRDSEWSRIPGIGDFAEQVRWACWRMSYHDGRAGGPRLVGWVHFGEDTVDPTWLSWDLLTGDADGMRERIVQRMSDLPVLYFPPDPAPTPTPPPTVPTPPVTPAPQPGVRPAVQVEPRDGWYAVCRRAYGAVSGPLIDQLRAANPEVTTLHAGQRLWVPGYEVRRV